MTKAVHTGLSAAALDRALEAFRGVVGSEHVLTGADIDEFRDWFWPQPWTEYDPSAVVRPGSTEEVQALIRLAAEHQVPLWPTSQGRNLGFGGGSSRVQGGVVINLRRMNRVLEINEELGYAVVEPGVSWIDLYAALRDSRSRLMLSVPSLGWGSVVGNSLEHGVTHGPNGADFAAPCGMEVVLADGTLLRTGMGGMPGNRTWHLFRPGLGPNLDQLFMQSNFGVVVRLGLWLIPAPEVYAPISIKVRREDDIGPLVDTLRRLRLDRTLEGVPIIYNTAAVAMAQERGSWYEGGGPTPDSVLDRIAGEVGVGRWTVQTAVWEDLDVADHKLDKLARAVEEIPGAELHFAKHSPEEIPELELSPDGALGGVPRPGGLTACRWYGTEARAHAGTGLVVPLQGREATRVHSMVREIVEQEFGLDCFAYLVVINARSYVYEFTAIFDATDQADSRRAYAACRRVLLAGADAGYGSARAHLDSMDLAASTYSFEDSAQRRLFERIKDAVDPAGIIAPGKQGIWPRSFRSDHRSLPGPEMDS